MPTKVIKRNEEDAPPTTDPKTIVWAIADMDHNDARRYVRRCLRLARTLGRREGAKRVAREVGEAVRGVPGSYEEPRLRLDAVGEPMGLHCDRHREFNAFCIDCASARALYREEGDDESPGV